MVWLINLVYGKFNNNKYFRQSLQLESIVSEGGKRKTRPEFPIGKPIVNTEYIVFSKKIKITNVDYSFTNENISYYWDKDNKTHLHIVHNMNGIVDYVLRFKTLNRVFVTDTIVNGNELVISIPEYLKDDLTDIIPPNINMEKDIWFELIIYKISSIEGKNNAFSYIENDIINTTYSFDISRLNTSVVDSILRNDNQRVLFHSKLKDKRITYVYPKDYSTTFNNVINYTSVYTQSFEIKETFLVHKNNTRAILLKHTLPGIVKAVLRYGSNNTMFEFNDYVEPGCIYIYWPDNTKFDTNFIIDLYTIH